MRAGLKINTWIILFGIILNFSCKELTTESISEGAIEFEITYPKADKNDLMASLMPETMLLRFKDNKITSEMNAGMGMFSTRFISDSENRTLSQMVKIMNKKIAHKENEDGVKKMMEEEQKFKVEFVNDTKDIAGYPCKKAIITLANDGNEKYEVYYTDKIEIKTPNWSTPYEKINGVLLEYEMSRYNVHMKFTAKKISKTAVEDEEFEIPEEYKMVSIREIDEVFENFQ